MQSTLNWAKLYAQGRCKDVGVPWSDEERVAVHIKGIPVDYVRSGILNEEDYIKALDKESKYGKSLDREDINKLREIAKEEGVVVTKETPKSVLVREIKQKRDGKKRAAEQAKSIKLAKEKFEKDMAKQTAKEEKAVAKEKEALESKESKK